MKKIYVILDWAGNDVFNGKEFKSFDDADEFLTEFIETMAPHMLEDEKAFYAEKDEYRIIERE